MIFAPITRVNHHGRSVMLGCGFLPNETTESFVWLFQQRLAAMPGEPPKAIMTDQDMAMTRASYGPSRCLPLLLYFTHYAKDV